MKSGTVAAYRPDLATDGRYENGASVSAKVVFSPGYRPEALADERKSGCNSV
jgi:hypothetical protein